MSTIEGSLRKQLIRPLTESGTKFYVAFSAAAVLSIVGIGAWIYQLNSGMHITGLGDWGTMAGAPWGLYIGTFIWWVGIAHGGIAISAAVRLFSLEKYLPIARIAEVLTLIALPMAALNIIYDLGRPSMMYEIFLNYPSAVQSSPLAWDVTAVFLYLTLSATYLWLTVREDVYELRKEGALPSYLSPVYSLILIGYRPGEEEKTRQMNWWLAVAILLLVPLLSGGVVPWLYATMGMHPGWWGAAQGPAMLAESLTSAIAVVIVVSATFRYAYDWEEIITKDIFRGLNKVMIGLIVVTLWFVLQDLVTGLGPAAPVDEAAVTEALISGSLSPLFWGSVGGLGIGLIYTTAVTLRPQWFSVGGTVAAAAIVSVSILAKKFLFVIEGLVHPSRSPISDLFPDGSYTPTLVEFAVASGTIGMAALGFMIISKIIPIVEVERLWGVKKE